MNIMYLRYAVEVARCGSINRAAENLYMAQPNLSRAIRELETDLGITLFSRTNKGMTPTPDGEKLLAYARRIISQIEEVKSMFREGHVEKERFSISVPRTSYVGQAFLNFSRRVPKGKKTELFYKETNSLRAINNILHNDYNLGIIRYAAQHERYFADMLAEKGLVGEMITEFKYVLAFGKAHPLADKKEIGYADLAPYVEIAHADPYVPSLPLSEVRKEELPDNTDRRIFVFERASQFELLSENPETFMWIAPIPEEVATRFSLVQRVCGENKKRYRDVLIYRQNYRLSEFDKMFIEELHRAKGRVL